MIKIPSPWHYSYNLVCDVRKISVILSSGNHYPAFWRIIIIVTSATDIIGAIMGRKKFSQREIDIIRKLLGRKMSGNRAQQKMVRHTMRTVFEFNISDFNIQGTAFGPKDLDECVRRGRIQILDEATIDAMKARHEEKRRYDECLKQAEAIADGETVNWENVLKEWNEYYANHPEEAAQ